MLEPNFFTLKIHCGDVTQNASPILCLYTEPIRLICNVPPTCYMSDGPLIYHNNNYGKIALYGPTVSRGVYTISQC